MDAWMRRWMDACKNVWVDVDGCVDRMDAFIIDAFMDGCVDGWMRG